MPGDPQGFCILHSEDKGKDPEAFKKAVQARLDQEESKSHDFSGVFFPGPFDPKAFFGSREFNKSVTFFEAIFVDRAIFIAATFAEGADFVSAKFKKGADFSGATFKEMAAFFESTFTQPASFRKATFTGKAIFSKATFTERAKAHFIEATFMEEADFSGANFKGTAIFQGANFNKVSFSWAKFYKDVSFYESIFKKEASFLGVTFNERAYFDEAVIEGRVVFRRLNPPQEGEPPPSVFQGEFRYLQFRAGGVLRFQDLSLPYCKFEDSDLRQVQFHHVQWHPYRSRQAIYDEVLLRQDEKEHPWFWTWFWTWVSCHLPMRFFALESGIQLPQYLKEEFPPPDPPWGDYYGAVERLYRYLKINYEKENDYKNAGDFHYGEMEMHRRASKWRWFPFYWYNLYWFLSGYGERPSRAFGLLIFFLAVLTGLLEWAGLEILDPKHSNGFWDPFFYLLQKVTLQRPTWAEPVGFGGKLVAGFSVLLIPGQAALFLLALRNRLGRRR